MRTIVRLDDHAKNEGTSVRYLDGRRCEGGAEGGNSDQQHARQADDGGHCNSN